MSQILIGTSGYDYPEWRGVFYPQNLKRKDFLSYYASQFNALELNNTFYNMPTAERMQGFYEKSGGQLQFSIKANRLLTHETNRQWQTAAQDFLTALEPLFQKDSLSSILFQFPQSFHYTVDNRIYLSNLLEKFEKFPCVIEFRHVEWIKNSVLEGLEKRGAGIVFCDMPSLKYLPDGKTMKTPFVGNTAYIRLHGRNEKAWYAEGNSLNGSERYNYNYTDSELQEFVPVIQQALVEQKKVQVFFNNHPNGNGARNAQRLAKALM